MKIIVAGGRDFLTFQHYALLKERLDYFFKNLEKVIILSGKAKGADSLGEIYAKDNNIPIEEYPADWSLGKKAGPLRNKQMANNADALVAFWDGKSQGTKNMINLAKAKGLKVKIVKY